jgi:MftR C-terminal domain
MHEALLEAVGDELAKQMERGVLMMSVADLRMRALDQIVSSLEIFSVAVGERIGRAPDDPRVRTIVGAVMGAVLIAWFGPGGHPVAISSSAWTRASRSSRPACRPEGRPARARGRTSGRGVRRGSARSAPRSR